MFLKLSYNSLALLRVNQLSEKKIVNFALKRDNLKKKDETAKFRVNWGSWLYSP